MFGVSAMAQVSVTFQVDMNGQTVSPNGVHVAGNWQDEAGYPAEWEPGTAEMTDDDSDGIYSLTVDIPAGQYEYKFINDNNWGPGEEGIPVISQKGGGTSNRVFIVTDWHGNTDNLPDGFMLPAIEFGGSAPAGEVAVRLVVDMAAQSEISELGVHVAGTLLDPEWTPAYGTMFNSSNSQYAYIANVDPDATYSYKFLNGNDWGMDEWTGGIPPAPEECTTGGNRAVTVVADDVTIPTVCYEACETCADPGIVTLTVDMSNETLINGVAYVAGSFNGFSDEEMTDNGDGTFSAEYTLEPGTYEFKFKNQPGNDGWELVPDACQGEGTDNRAFTVGEAEELSVTSCFEQCVEVCIPNPDPSDITFRVNMMNVTVAPEGVWVMGSFTSPNWQPGAIQMTDADSDGIYEVTVEDVSGSADIAYKFANGDPMTTEETGDFAAGGCGFATDLGGFNRSLVRTGEPMVLDVVCYNSCADCVVGLEENVLGSVSIFPNPSNGISYIDIENPNGYTLRMNLVDITGKTVTENILLNSTRNEINTKNLNAGLYFLNIVNEHNDRAVYKLMVK